MDKQQLIRIFDKQADQYARDREGAKQKLWRQNLLSHAKGDVLELAVGAGANFPYYPSGVSVTAIDISKAMIEKAQHSAVRNRMNVEFICSDMENVDFEPHKFDTIVSTLSFCSYEEPLALLKKINRWCKPDGHILLMEHGISSYPIVSSIQRGLNPLLYRKFGCHHTRNILQLIQDSGMRIVTAERHWLNMVHLVRAQPSR